MLKVCADLANEKGENEYAVMTLEQWDLDGPWRLKIAVAPDQGDDE